MTGLTLSDIPNYKLFYRQGGSDIRGAGGDDGRRIVKAVIAIRDDALLLEVRQQLVEGFPATSRYKGVLNPDKVAQRLCLKNTLVQCPSKPLELGIAFTI